MLRSLLLLAFCIFSGNQSFATNLDEEVRGLNIGYKSNEAFVEVIEAFRSKIEPPYKAVKTFVDDICWSKNKAIIEEDLDINIDKIMYPIKRQIEDYSLDEDGTMSKVAKDFFLNLEGEFLKKFNKSDTYYFMDQISGRLTLGLRYGTQWFGGD